MPPEQIWRYLPLIVNPGYSCLFSGDKAEGKTDTLPRTLVETLHATSPGSGGTSPWNVWQQRKPICRGGFSRSIWLVTDNWTTKPALYSSHFPTQHSSTRKSAV